MASSPSMKLPPEIAAAVIKATAVELADRMKDNLEDLEVFTIKEVCERLKVSRKKAYGLIREIVDLGEGSPRISAAQLRKLIDDRTVPA